MARLTIGQKAERVLKLLYGLRNPRVALLLAAYGFTKEDLDTGWSRLQALTKNRLDVHTPTTDPKLYEELDAWENHWFPIASASLQYRHPKVHAWLFLNLSQTEGLEVVVSVAKFLERLAQLPKEKGLENAAEAAQLLQKRGLTGAVVGQAEQLLTRLQQVGTIKPPEPPSPEEQQAAEDALWAWYIEWSQIARTVVKDRRLLRELGFLRTRTRTVEEIEEEDVLDEEEQTTPAPATGAARSAAATAQ